MFDSSRFQIRVEIEIRASHFRRVGRDLLVPRLAQLLSQLPLDGFARQCGGRHLCPFGLRPEAGVGMLRQWQMKILHTLALRLLCHEFMAWANAMTLSSRRPTAGVYCG